MVYRNNKEALMKLTSPAFENQGSIPEVYSFEEGDGINPELRIEDIPEGTKSLLLIMTDLDAPAGNFLHWIVFDIPPETRVIERDSIPGKQGISSAKRKNYAGPRPPSGTHRYDFIIYALDTLLNLPDGTDKDTIMKAMQGHVIAKADLVGKYGRRVKATV
jgi:Raf kinase inhibitor-like YbhB/YbcL family protein